MPVPVPVPEPELQATANLSPVSPSPVHSVVSQVVPVLQDTVDTIDAMVAAAAAAAAQAAATNGASEGAHDIDLNTDAGDVDDIVDDDSLNDPYGEIDTDVAQPEPQHPQELPDDSNDDYAKTFDSPIDPEEGEGEDEDVQPEHVSSVLHQSNDNATSSDHLTSRPSEASRVHPESIVANTANVTSQLANPEQSDSQSATSPSTAKEDSSSAESPNASADIQRLVADLTAPAEPNSNSAPSASSAKTEPPSGPSSLPSTLPSSTSLPPRPPLPNAASQSYASQHHPAGSISSVPTNNIAPPTPGQPSTYVVAGAPSIVADAISNLSPPNTALNAPVAITSMTAPPYPAQPATVAADRAPDEYERQWDQFMADERQYMSEAKWDRFPDGSRIFIGTRSAPGASKIGAHIFSAGNLSSDKVSKRDVFDLFHRFGRLAQISLKSAYGFVQYHTVEEGQGAMDNLQGIEIKGRRIHLEISRVQDKGKKERVRSPERGPGREGSRRNDRNDRYGPQGRDDYRSGGRNHSPRRNDHQRDDGYGRERDRDRDRGYHDGGRSRNRSRSPGYGRNDKDKYRRRSHSPYDRSRQHEAEIDIPRRFGADVPDVQIILQPDVHKDFVSWVEAAFKAKGLKSAVMYLHPRIPKESVIQRQAAEGVHAVVDLDLRAQNLGKIPVQAYDRSGGAANVRFDQYVDLEPQTAAEVILRAKASGAAAANYAQPYSNGYNNPYGGQPAQQPHPSAFAAGHHPGQYPPQQAPANPVDVASLMGQLDPASLQRLLASVQANPQGGFPGALPQPGSNAAAPVNQQFDIQAILGSLGGNAAAAQQHPATQPPPYGIPYGAQPSNGAAPSNADTNSQVQNIMAQLARYRQ